MIGVPVKITKTLKNLVLFRVLLVFSSGPFLASHFLDQKYNFGNQDCKHPHKHLAYTESIKFAYSTSVFEKYKF
jgi:hypothetical protein